MQLGECRISDICRPPTSKVRTAIPRASDKKSHNPLGHLSALLSASFDIGKSSRHLPDGDISYIIKKDAAKPRSVYCSAHCQALLACLFPRGSARKMSQTGNNIYLLSQLSSARNHAEPRPPGPASLEGLTRVCLASRNIESIPGPGDGWNIS